VGKLAVLESATVICLRRATPRPGDEPDGSTMVLRRERFAMGQKRSPSVEMIFGGLDEIDFSTGWEVLMGQNECVNWVRSSDSDHLRFARYAGEYKFAGGLLEAGESFEDAARRELEEEFLRPLAIGLPQNAVLRPFVVKQTMPVQSKSNIMWNMVALAEENPWLQELDVAAANAQLAQHRAHFLEELVAEGAPKPGPFWGMSERQRETVAPEVRELRWLPLAGPSSSP